MFDLTVHYGTNSSLRNEKEAQKFRMRKLLKFPENQRDIRPAVEMPSSKSADGAKPIASSKRR
jgi:hypothetical protein